MYLKDYAIADCLRHKVFGIVSYQPLYGEQKPNKVCIMTRKGVYRFVNPLDLTDDVTENEMLDYWASINKE